MKIPTYTQTPGLNRYPEDERFAVYRATQQAIDAGEDVAYRRRFSSYLTALICLVIIPGCWYGHVAAYLVIRQQEFQNQRIGNVLQICAAA